MSLTPYSPFVLKATAPEPWNGRRVCGAGVAVISLVRGGSSIPSDFVGISVGGPLAERQRRRTSGRRTCGNAPVPGVRSGRKTSCACISRLDSTAIVMHSVYVAITAFTLDASPNGRTVHLVDVENLMGSAAFTAEAVAKVAAEYAVVADFRPDHFTVLASSHYAASAAWFGWPEARRLVWSGQDGADLALVDVILTEDLDRRFDRVIVASGDGIFSSPCAWLQQRGCSVTVVCRRSSLSRRLAFAVRDVRFLTEHDGTPNVVAGRRAA